MKMRRWFLLQTCILPELYITVYALNLLTCNLSQSSLRALKSNSSLLSTAGEKPVMVIIILVTDKCLYLVVSLSIHRLMLSNAFDYLVWLRDQRELKQTSSLGLTPPLDTRTCSTMEKRKYSNKHSNKKNTVCFKLLLYIHTHTPTFRYLYGVVEN